MKQITKNFGEKPAIIKRSDGIDIDIDTVDKIKESDKLIIKSMFYTKIIELTKSEVSEFVKYLISNLLVSVNSKMQAEQIRVLAENFENDLIMFSQHLTVQEIKLICYNGIRGKYNEEPSDSNLAIHNFYKWKQKYLKHRDECTYRIINLVNSIPVEVAYDFEKTVQQIKQILEIKKNKQQHDFLCLKFSSVVPSFLYDQLVKHNFLKELDFEKQLELAKTKFVHSSELSQSSQINDLLEVMYGVDISNYEQKIIQKAKQLAIYNFIHKLKKL
jgi:hypothetical protein